MCIIPAITTTINTSALMECCLDVDCLDHCWNHVSLILGILFFVWLPLRQQVAILHLSLLIFFSSMWYSATYDGCVWIILIIWIMKFPRSGLPSMYRWYCRFIGRFLFSKYVPYRALLELQGFCCPHDSCYTFLFPHKWLDNVCDATL